MKITIEPSAADPLPGQHSVVLDTGNNEELTDEAMLLAMSALVAYGHDARNVACAAMEHANDQLSVLDRK